MGKTYPDNIKSAYFAYHAFYLEILKSRFISREESVIKTRLNFWEERLTEIAKHVTIIKNEPNSSKKFNYIDPIEVALVNALTTTNIKIDTIFRIIDFQFFDLERKSQLNTVEDLEIYAENTRTLLLYLNLNLLDIKDENSFIVASHIGRGIGIVDVLKKMSNHLRMDINLLPKDLIEKHAGSYALMFDRRGDVSEGFYDIILEVAAYSKRHLEVGRELAKTNNLQKNSHVAFLQAIETSWWLSELEKYNFNPMTHNLLKPSTFTIPRLILSKGKQGLF